MNFTPEFMLQILVAIGSGVSVYSAIRSDLARLHERSTSTHEAINKAHARIDDHLAGHK